MATTVAKISSTTDITTLTAADFAKLTAADLGVLTKAQALLLAGNHLWNAGIFVWQVKNIIRAFEKHLPELAEVFEAEKSQLRAILDEPIPDNALLSAKVEAFKRKDAAAWKLGDHGNDPLADYLADIFTLPASLAGLPGMSLPVGFSNTAQDQGMPIGMQLIGNYFKEAQLLNAAHRFQLATDFHRAKPAGY